MQKAALLPSERENSGRVGWAVDIPTQDAVEIILIKFRLRLI